MSRVKRGVTSNKRRKNLLQRAKGFLHGGHSKFRLAKERLLKAESNAYIGRKLRKRDFRSLWIARINGALRQAETGFTYSQFMGKLNASGNELNRKMLSEIAIADIESFKKIVESVMVSK